MPADNLNTHEVAQYLGINEKQVYALIKARRIPCTRLTGKWVFPKHLLDAWLAADARARVEALPPGTRPEFGAVLAAGSNDPVLDILLSSLPPGRGTYLFSSVTGSTEGVRLVGRGCTDIAWCHLSDPATGEYDIPSLASQLGGRTFALVHLFRRPVGMVTAPGKRLRRADVRLLERRGLRLVNRQKGSGTRLLIDHQLAQAGVDPARVRGYEDEVNTHLEVGLRILAGEADVGVATVAVAQLLGLAFTLLLEESFDMVLSQELFFRQGIQDFIQVLNSPGFRARVEHLGRYDFSSSGRVLYASP
jgi:excisionase family DNA binding protein